MTQSTVPYSSATERFTKSFGGSLKSVMGGKGRTFFILEHKTSSAKHKVGESTEFIGDYVELGRGNKFAVNFGDDCGTVSRPHAAIVRSENGWIIKHLSAKNPTLVNGEPVNGQRTLENGDQIQLSYEGPKMVFLTPVNNTMRSMGMTVRLKAMTREALRPYRYAVSALAVLLLATACYAGYRVYNAQITVAQKEQAIQEKEKALGEMKAELEKMKTVNADQAQQIKRKNSENQQLQLKLRNNNITYNAPSGGGGNHTNNSTPPPSGDLSSSLKATFGSVFYIQTERIEYSIGGETRVLEDDAGNPTGISGTGFLLSNGRFITARHVAKPWLYPSDDAFVILNLVANNGGSVVHYFTAYTSSGQRMSFSSEDFRDNDNDDEIRQTEDDEGNAYIVRLGSPVQDWAYAATRKNGALQSDPSAACNLDAATQLHILGFPLGIGGGSHPGDPTYSNCTVGRRGCPDGVISITDQNIDHGNSGGPVFYYDGNQMVVIGIVSAIIGNAQGSIVPISLVR